MFRVRSLTQQRSVQLGVLAAIAAAVVGQGCPAPQPPGNGGGNGTTNAKYVGNDSCYTCHANTHSNWAATNHANAYETLVDLGQQDNAVCLACHTTGFGEQDGFTNASDTPSLASVGCESCHGPSGDHVRNVNDRALRPTVSMSSQLCARCHNDFHHDTYDEWASSKHSRVDEHVAESFAASTSLGSCGACHSGDYRQARFIDNEPTVPDSLLAGVAHEDMNGVTCQVCHDPHVVTGNTAQLRYPQTASPEPTNTVAAVTNPERFELCGQCHHSRGRLWTDNSRGPHHSIQANFYVGEMPAPEGQAPLVANQRTVHRFVFKQCSTCHMQHEVHLTDTGEVGQTHAGHIFKIESYSGCSTSGCHPTPESAQADTIALQTSVESTLASLKTRMGAESTWQYSSGGGPAAAQQTNIPEAVRKVRFLIAYLESDGSLGVHNPEYTRAILAEADRLLQSVQQ